MLPLLDVDMIRRTPKLFIGYSDNTSILSWLTCQCGITALHGPMIEGRLARGAAGFDEASMLAFMQNGAGRTLSPDRLAVVRGGEAAGPLFGGTSPARGIARHPVRLRPARPAIRDQSRP